MTYDSLVNHGDYLSAHYLAEVLPKDLKAKDGLLARWTEREEAERKRHRAALAEAERQGDDADSVPPRARTPREGLRALRGPYFAGRADFEQDAAAEPAPADWAKRVTDLHLATLRALGFTGAHEQPVTVRRAEHEYTVTALHAEPGLIAVSCGWAVEPDAALDPEGPGRLLHPVELAASGRLTDGKALTDFLLAADEPPRYVLLLVGGVVVLADRMAWHEGRYLAVSLDTALNRLDERSGGELDTIAALFGADSLRVPEEGGAAPLAGFLDKSGKHAVGVSTELREGLRLSVEWIADAVLDRLREQGVSPEQIEDPVRLAKQLSREALRYLYRILFLLYAEAKPELGILPADDPEYQQGYGLQRLGDLVVRDLIGERSRRGFHLYESLDLLFRMVDAGHREQGSLPEDGADGAAGEDGEETVSVGAGLRFEPMRSELFAARSVELIGTGRIPNPHFSRDDDGTLADPEQPEYLDTRLRNTTLHKVLRRLMLTRGKGAERGGFISYGLLGINQLGAVYEGLMSYTGFIAQEDLYEVAKGGESGSGSWMVPASKVQDYPDEVFIQRSDDETGLKQRVVHGKGSFVYRLAGRDRQTSASYYTPKSLTEVTVELALRHRLSADTPAQELLGWKICEPALGSGAFLNEAIDQVAAEYLRRRERETGERIDTEQRQIELQKVKAYIALHNAYGVDLNATAVELAEVSLWLNTMHPGMRAPWFGLHLRRGNSLIGAARKVYEAGDLAGGAWLARKDPLPPRDLPFRDGPLPEGAVHQFLLPAVGWGAVAGEAEAKKLAPVAAKQLADWRRGVQKAPKKKSDLRRLQGIAKRVEFLWDVVERRLELSEKAVARKVDVWQADWLKQPDTAVDKQRVLDDLTAVGTPYWRLKKVMDAWCALWFWPLDRVAELDGTAHVYEAYAVGGGVVAEADVAALIAGQAVTGQAGAGPEAGAGVAAEPLVEPSGPAPGDLVWEHTGLFDDPNGEQGELAVDLTADMPKLRRSGPRVSRDLEVVDPWRKVIPLKGLGDWIDFLECLVGSKDIPDDSLVEGITNLPVLAEFEGRLAGLMGMDAAPLRLETRFPWLAGVQDIAGSTEREIAAEDGHGFFHWELHFAHIFKGERGGFDLQVGNPPWVQPEWLENQVLAEGDPWFMLTEKPSAEARQAHKGALLGEPGALRYYLGELTGVSGISEVLGSPAMYPLLAGTRPDLYRAFMCQIWKHMGAYGSAGLVHPDSHFSGDKEARLREAAYERLRVHGDFVNAGNRFFPPPVGRSSHFGVHIYGEQGEIGFDHLSWLFSVDALRLSSEDDGEAPDPGVRYGSTWDERPHRKRIIRVDEETLARWQRLTGDEDQPVRQARLLSPVSTAEAQGIEALSRYSLRLGTFDHEITHGYNEWNAKRDGLIDYNRVDGDGWLHRPTSWSEVILKGPQIGLANPMFKQPSQGGGEVLGLNPLTLADGAVPETEYVYVADETVYKGVQDRWLDHGRLADLRTSGAAVANARAVVAAGRAVPLEQVADLEADSYLAEASRRPYTDFYRVAWREFIAPDTERSLYTAVLPPGPTHIHAVRSASVGTNRSTVLTAGFWSGVPLDYLLRSTRVRHLDVTPARRLPVPAANHPLASALLLRTMRLNSLTTAYANLWAELYDPRWPAYEPWAYDWPGLRPLHEVQPTWNQSTPLRTERGRRAALVEIDALVAVWLGVSADALVAMYKSRFPIMQAFDAVMWFDANERKLAGDRYTYGFGQTKEHWQQFLAYQQGECAEPPEGYAAPFYKADRESEMRAAHAYFSARVADTPSLSGVGR
ncbi:hypothetical protein ACIGXA_39740 [Streptomyces fildesensis]|uniref:site-specific DNA-methyltransferase (adenine-specific) n=1 Tax=Streptomyces fildesensis TaxID=375757 RepID=A0ABW8CLK2_9ACTN